MSNPIPTTALDAAAAAEAVQERRERDAHLDEANTALVVALANLGIVRVEAEITNTQDKPRIDDITAFTEATTFGWGENHQTYDNCCRLHLRGVGAPARQAPHQQDLRSYTSLHEFADEFAWEVLTALHGGFENNDGGFGKVVIDVSEGKVRLEHNWCIASSEYTEAEF